MEPLPGGDPGLQKMEEGLGNGNGAFLSRVCPGQQVHAPADLIPHQDLYCELEVKSLPQVSFIKALYHSNKKRN